MENRNARPLADLKGEIDALEESAKGIAHRVAESHPERSVLAFQAEWHVRSMLYHLRRLFDQYLLFAHEVSMRAGTGASDLIMYAPSYQEMLFEFYALVAICRISLDNLRMYLRPLFTRQSHQLPKSIRDVLAGTTTCPIYNVLAGQPIVDYLLDLRNCLVHYRSLATSDNAIVQEEGSPVPDFEDDEPFFAAMARAEFRRVGEGGISVNVYLPDRIFETDSRGGKRLAAFTFSDKWNLLSMARSFADVAGRSLSLTLECLRTLPDASFEFHAKPHNAHPKPSR